MFRLQRPWLRAGILLVVAAIWTLQFDVAIAGPLPQPSGDYETEALALCHDGDLECVKATLDAMRQHTRQLAEECDHNAVFAALYTVVTTHYYDTVTADPEFFTDNAFVNHEDVVFAHYYFWPYVNWRSGMHDAVPPAWRIAFDAADNQEVTATGNLLLGINAHVVRDLPFVLSRLGLGDKRNHDRVNDILRRAYEPALQTINDHLADSIDEANIEGTSLDEDALFQIVASWREQAWHDATLLSAASTALERAVIQAEIEEKARLQARTFRTQYAYPAATRDREARNEYCGIHAWPPDWLGGE